MLNLKLKKSILNETSPNNPAFISDSNIVKIISKDGAIQEFDRLPKKDIAWEIIKLINI